MLFLAPAAGLIGAAIAVPALLALYLLKLRRRPLRVSSTFLWEQTLRDEQANVPLRWLRASWPLALQLLALLSLLAAIARPAVPANSSVAARVVLVIDRSASMSATDGQPSASPGEPPRTRLDEAKAEALRVVSDLRRATGNTRGTRPEAMVIAIAGDARVITGFTSDARSLREAIENIGPSDQAGDWEAAAPLIRAAAGSDAASVNEDSPATANSLTPTAQPALARKTDVLVFSDGALSGDGTHTGRIPGADVRLVGCGPDPGPPPARLRPDNLGIVAINARRDAESPATVRVFVRVQNAGPEQVAATVRCTIDDQRTGTLALTLPEARVSDACVFAPGEASGVLEFERPAGGLLVVNILRDDVLASDNAAAMVIGAVTAARVLVIGPGENREDDPYRALRGDRGVDRLLLGVLAELGLAELRVVSQADYEAGLSGAEGSDWKRFDLLIFDRVEPRGVPAQPSLSFGAGMGGPDGVRVEQPETAGDRTPTRFIAWKRTHPLLRSTPLDAVLVAPPMRMVLPPESTSDAAVRMVATPIAFGIGGPLVAVLEEPAVGSSKHVLVGMDLLNSNWGKDVSFPVFVATAAEYLTGRGDAAAGRFVTTSDPVTVRARPGVKSIAAVGPVAVSAEVNQLGTAALGVLERVGVYRVEGAVENDATVAVNLLSTAESSVQVETRFGGPSAGSRPREEAGTGEGKPEPAGMREVWHWFVFLAFALVTLEWCVYAWRVRV